MSVYVAGVGTTSFEGETTRSVLDLAATAADRALADAGRERAAVSSVHLGNALAEATGCEGGLANAFVSELGIEGARADRVENTSATGASAAHRGVEAVASGTADVALVVGVEKMSGADTADTTDAISRLTHEREYAQGVTLPSFGGLAAGAYLDRYDAPREALAAVAVKNHRNAVDNPVAQFQRELSVEDVLEAPQVADPLGLYDCCPMTDGAAALVLVDEPTDVRVAGFGSATDTHAVAARDDLLEMRSVRDASRRAFERGKIEPADVDVACIHDAFTVLGLLELEKM
jgi:acetyl-CoA C-acetyltransferase/acetyl-CoA acyltransferase